MHRCTNDNTGTLAHKITLVLRETKYTTPLLTKMFFFQKTPATLNNFSGLERTLMI